MRQQKVVAVVKVLPTAMPARGCDRDCGGYSAKGRPKYDISIECLNTASNIQKPSKVPVKVKLLMIYPNTEAINMGCWQMPSQPMAFASITTF